MQNETMHQDEWHVRVGTLDEHGPDGLPVFVGFIANAPEPFDQVRFLWVSANDHVAFGLDSLPTPSGTLPVRWDHGPNEGDLVVERTEDGFARYLAMVANSDIAQERVALDVGHHLLTEVMGAMMGSEAPGDEPPTGFYL